MERTILKRGQKFSWKKFIALTIAGFVIIGAISALFRLYIINRDFLIVRVDDPIATEFIVLDGKKYVKDYRAERVIFIDKTTGMLIEYPEQEVQNFQQYWYFNKIRERDFVFVNDDREIVSIHKSSQIDYNKPISSNSPASMRIELFAGQANKLGLQVGMSISIMHSVTKFAY